MTEINFNAVLQHYMCTQIRTHELALFNNHLLPQVLINIHIVYI